LLSSLQQDEGPIWAGDRLNYRATSERAVRGAIAGRDVVSFIGAVGSAYRHYFKFSGRASLSEYWWFALFVIGLPFVMILTLMLIGPTVYRVGSTYYTSPDQGAGGAVSAVVVLACFALIIASIIPHFSLASRRLHDTGRTGWWQLVVLVPWLGGLVLLVLLALKGTPGPNKYGPRPGFPEESIAGQSVDVSGSTASQPATPMDTGQPSA
jgi:uncharacterized membrane protein YhaH (DUF805 family)